MPLKGWIAIIFVAVAVAGFLWAPCPVFQVQAQSQAAHEAASIGTASMDKNGTIILDLRAESPQGDVGNGRLVCPPSHHQYQEVLRHLGGLRPGETKPVPPWPDSR